MRRTAILYLSLWLAGASALAVDSVVVFNEINYHPATNEAAQEWIELHNQMAIDIDLSAWRIAGDVNYTFVEGTIIPGGGYLVIASNPGALLTTISATNVVGPFTGRLNNGTGNLRLRDRNDRLMDEIEYRDEGKWPVAADGSGATLAKHNQDATSGPPENWTSSVIARGTPGERNFPVTVTAQRRTLVPFNALWRFDATATDLGTAWREPAFNDTAWSGRNNATLVSYWPFDGTANATRGISGTFVNVVTPTTDRNNAPAGALLFNGVNAYVSVAGGGGLNAAAAGTISMWVKWTGVQDADCCGTYGAVLARQGNGLFSDNIIALNGPTPETAVIVWRQSGGPAPILITGTTAVGTSWHHIAVTFANSGSTLYVDGIAQGSAVGAGMNNNSGVPLSIGAWGGDGAGFAGASIDDVAIWDSPLSAAQIAELAAQTRTPLHFADPENAVYYAGDGRLTSNDDLRHTELPLGPNTYYFRHRFVFNDDPARTQLNLDLAVDDGAVFYLNGAEIYRHNMPGGAVTYSTFASSAVVDASIINGISVPVSNLIRGTNVFAVEVHQATSSDSGMIFGAGLSGTVEPATVLETRTLVNLHDIWRYEATDTDLGASWRDPAYSDAGWLTGSAVIYAGSGAIDGLAPERITGITATASTQYTPDGRLAINAANGAGLVGNAHVTTPQNTMWLNNGTFATPNDLNPFIIFDLGGVYPVRSMKVWNYNEFLPGRPDLLARGASRADILVGTATDALSTFITGQSFTQAPGTQTDFSQTIDLGNVTTRYVRLEKLTNFPGGDNNFVGLSEVQFFHDADLRRTEAPLGAVTYYFRKAFTFGADPARASLVLNAAIDDGAVIYLNGVEIHRINMPGGAVTHTTLAANPIANATFSGVIELPGSALVHGTNILAVEVHQAAATDDPDMVFGLELFARVAPRDPADFDAGNLLFSEITAADAMPLQIELVNRGTTSLDVGGYVIQRTGPSPDAEHTLAPFTLGPGEFLVVSQTTLGFGAQAGDKLFLLSPGKLVIADAVEVHERPRARPFDGINDWLTPNVVTVGTSNSFSLRDEIVINEIMYHAPPTLELPAVIGTNFVVTITNVWKYEESGTDLGTAWRAPNYDDGAWLSGAALLYNSTNNLPAPKNTPLTLGPITYYFRTTFVYTGAPPILALWLRHIIDDGAIIYLNGNEVHRFNVPPGNITYTNRASSAILNAIYRSPVPINLTNLVVGTNVIAVEVHQAANTGNDVAFGCEMWARIEAIPRVPFSESREGWVELLNRGSNAVNLTGWRLDEGIDYRFPTNTMIAPGGYLVIAKDSTNLLANFPGIDVVGPYNNALSHRGERIVLKDASDNPADWVHYFDDGRWPRAADGRGASLELRDPYADNSAGEAWAASDETGRSSWRTYTYRGFGAASAFGPDGQWREFVMGLLTAGEVLLDDITVTTNGVQILQNGTFETGLNAWRIIGNHHGEVIDDPNQPGNKVLRLIATGSTEHMNNHAETTLAGNFDIVVGREYVITYRAKWINGSRQLNTRLYFNRLVRTTLLDAPAIRGTPGAQNTAYAANIGPTYSNLRHDPPVPAAFTPVTVSVEARDPDGLASVTLWSAVNGASWTSAPMLLTGNGVYSAELLGRAARTVTQFYVEAVDNLGATSTFPAAARDSRALYQVNDELAATNGLHNMRLIALTQDSDELFRTINLMSNERIGCTVIYDERDIFYDCGLRLKGSEHSRTTTPRLGFNVAFTSEQRLRGVHDTVAIDRSESTGFGQREMLIHQTLNHAGGVPTKYHDLIQVMAPRSEYTGSAELQLARYTDVFLDDHFDDGSDGTVFEYELVYQLNTTDTGTPEGNKVPAPDSVVGTAIRNLGDDKEGYRWTFLIKNNEEKDDYSGIMAFAKTMELANPAFTNQIANYIDVDAWLRGTAVNALSGAGDSYGGDGSQHNVQFYVRPSDNKIIFLPHDVDAFFSATRPIVPNNDTTKIMAVPAWARAYYCHLLDIIATTYNANYMTRWANHFGRLLPAQNFSSHLSFLVQRSDFVTSQVNSAVPNVSFSITSNNGNNFGTTNNTIMLTGNAGLSVKTILVNGVAYPINWVTITSWSIPIALFAGANPITIQGVNSAGVRLTNAFDTITVTNNGSGAPLPIVINEWMADNDRPGGYVDIVDGQFEDWFELYNPNTNALNIGGFFLSDNPGNPMKWRIPTPTIIPARGFLLVWADDDPSQNALDTNGHLHAAFQLNRDGDNIGLYTSDGVPQHVITFGQQYLNISQGLFPDGSTNVYYMTNWTPRFPNTLADPLRVTAINVTGAVVTITWAASPGANYRIQYKDRIEDTAWTSLGPTVFADDTAESVTDTPPGPIRFYRVILVGSE
jgi:hypothetical protein